MVPWRLLDPSCKCTYNGFMRTWNLAPGDPLLLTLSADARLGGLDFLDDQTWALDLRSGEPPALLLHSSLGLRVKWVRLYPGFSLGGSPVTDPRAFFSPPSVLSFYPNYICVTCFPFKEIEALIEYWVPASSELCGRITLRSHASQAQAVQVNLFAHMNPLTSGQPFSPLREGKAQHLAACSQDLTMVCALSGHPRVEQAHNAALAVEVHLRPHASQPLNWALASRKDQPGALSAARRLLTRRWDAECARLQLLNASQQVEIVTGNDDWDAVLAFSQKAAFSLFFPGGDRLPFDTFVLARAPDHGYSMRGDGSDYPDTWKGQTALDAHHLADLLMPGACEQVKGVLRNFFDRQQPDGALEWRPGLAGKSSPWLAQPILADLAWQVYEVEGDPAWLEEVYPKLLAFTRLWFSARHDRDGDSYPEWEHARQTGLEDLPLYDRYQPHAQAVDITTLECPALAAFLFRDLRCLAQMAAVLRQDDALAWLQEKSHALKTALDASLNPLTQGFAYRDRDSHQVTAGGALEAFSGAGIHSVQRCFSPARRIRLTYTPQNQSTHPIIVKLSGDTPQGSALETLQAPAWSWLSGRTAATSQTLFTRLGEVDIRGVEEQDQVRLDLIDTTQEDISLFLPLWAGAADQAAAERVINNALLPRFTRPYGLVTCPASASYPETPALGAVSPLWNSFILEALIQYGYTSAAADLFTLMMEAAAHSLQNWNAFFEGYDAESAAPVGERNHLRGLVPVRLLLRLIGIRKLTNSEIIIAGFCPFPGPILVKYQGVEIQSHSTHVVITFPNGQSARIEEPGLYQVALNLTP